MEQAVTNKPAKATRCAIYTRVSSDQGLEQDFNSLDNQREAAEAYIKSQAHEGWRCLPAAYDDGGFSGGTIERPALKRLLADIRARLIDVVVVYKVDRLTRSLADFAKLVELFDQHEVSFVSVTQSFNTTTSMGRLTLNVLLSFAQFEREVTAERIRDKIAASKRKGMRMGGPVPLGYNVEVTGHPGVASGSPRGRWPIFSRTGSMWARSSTKGSTIQVSTSQLSSGNCSMRSSRGWRLAPKLVATLGLTTARS
jgi:DNA invertase Pin-like site-specific DNA recombinase